MVRWRACLPLLSGAVQVGAEDRLVSSMRRDSGSAAEVEVLGSFLILRFRSWWAGVEEQTQNYLALHSVAVPGESR